MKSKNFVFILMLQFFIDTVFSFEETESEDSPMLPIVFQTVNDACATIEECKFECCQLNKIHSIATNRCASEDIDRQLSDVNWKAPFSAYHRLACESLCSENSTEEMAEDENFRIFIHNVTSEPDYLCDFFIDVCYSYSTTEMHWAKFAAIYSLKTTLAVVAAGFSMLFMSVTLLVYLAVPQLCHRTQDKCFLFHLGFRIVHFGIYLIVVFFDNEGLVCKFYAFVLQFAGLAAAFWLNVICFHLWRSINSVIPTFQSHTRTICHYSLYACGYPLLITVITHLADSWLPDEFQSFKPCIGKQVCGIIGYDKNSGTQLWLQPLFIYYFSFQTILQFINLGAFLHIVFILLSKEKLFKKKGNETFRRHQIQQPGFLLYVKLFLLMSLTILLEMIFIHLDRPPVEKLFLRFLSDFLLFVIFVCNERVFRLLKTTYLSLTSSQYTIQNIKTGGHCTLVRESTRTKD